MSITLRQCLRKLPRREKLKSPEVTTLDRPAWFGELAARGCAIYFYRDRIQSSDEPVAQRAQVLVVRRVMTAYGHTIPVTPDARIRCFGVERR